MAGTDGTRRMRYCEQCQAERRVIVTVDWQDDFCSRCGSAV